MRILALMLLAGVAHADVNVVCGPSPIEYSQRVIGEKVQHWTCVLENRGPDTVVKEADVLAVLLRGGVQALSSDAVRAGWVEVKRRGKWSTASRLVGHGGLLAAALAAGDIIAIGPAWGAVAGFTALQMPQVAQGLEGRNAPTGLFDSLAMPSEGVPLAAGESAVVNMFGAEQKLGNVDGVILRSDLPGGGTMLSEAERDEVLARYVMDAPLDNFVDAD